MNFDALPYHLQAYARAMYKSMMAKATEHFPPTD